MAIKAGQILHLGNDQFLIDRIQSAGVPNINIPRDRIFELGNYLTLGNVRDIPDLGFTMDSYDMSTELPALLTGVAPSTLTSGSYVDFANLKPMDIVSPFKKTTTLPGSNTSTSVAGVALPYLFLESVSYRFGVSALSSVSYNLRGDSIYYVPNGTPYVMTKTLASWTAGPHTFTLPSAAGGGSTTAIAYNENGVDTYALSVVEITTAGDHVRKTLGVDYTETATGITFTTSGTPAANSVVRIVFGSATTSTFTETGTAASPVVLGSNIHNPVTTNAGTGLSAPAAVRGRYVEVYVGLDAQATPKPLKFSRVQTANVNWRVNLERDEEFNNKRVVSMDYNDTPDISGQLSVKAQSPAELMAKIAQACNTTTGKITGPLYQGTVPVELKVKDSGGNTISGLYIPNCSFDVPGYEQRVQQKNITSFNFYSEDGVFQVYKGDRPGS